MLLDVAGYSLFNNNSVDWNVIETVLTTGLGVIAGGVILVVLTFFALIGIVAFSVRRGVVNRSVPKTIGAFFRLSGILLGVIFSTLFMPIALLLKISTGTIAVVAALVIGVCFLAGRAISKMIGWRLQRYGFYIRTFDILRSKILRIVYSI